MQLLTVVNIYMLMFVLVFLVIISRAGRPGYRSIRILPIFKTQVPMRRVCV